MFHSPSPAEFNHAALRLELASSVMAAWHPTGDDVRDEQEFGRIEDEYLRASVDLSGMIERATGLTADRLGRLL